MDWRTASYITLSLWASYMLFGDKATAIHGARMSMFFEGAAMMAVGIFGVIGHAGDFSLVTLRSGTLALIMALMSGIGLFIQLYALQVAPSKEVFPAITMITGSWPAITVVLACVFLGSRLEFQQWLGVVMVAGGLLLVNWTK